MDFIDEIVPSIVIGCCRVCLSHDGVFYEIFGDGAVEDGVRIAQMLRECSSYTVDLADNIPHQICRTCLENATFAHRFRRQADSSYRYLTGIMQMPQKSAIMLVEIGTQTDKSDYMQEFKKEQSEQLDHVQQQFYTTLNNNNNDNSLNNNNSNSTSIILSNNELSYEKQTVGFEAMLYDDDIDDGDVDGAGDDDDNLMPSISSSSLTSTITEDPPPIKSLTPSPESTRTRRQYRNIKHCTITTDCKLCGAKHNCLLELRDHLMVEHMFIELTLGLQCRLCDHEYSRKDHLVRHLRNIHKVSRDREDGRIKIDEPQTITMGQCVNDNENEETEDMGAAGTKTTTPTKLESASGLKKLSATTNQSPSKRSLSSLSPRQMSTNVVDGFLHEPEFVRSGDESLNFKVKLLRTNFSQYDDPLNDSSNVVNVEKNRNEIDIDNIDESDQDDGGGDDYDDDGGATAMAANIEYDDNVNIEYDDNVNMEADDDDDDVDCASDTKTCLSFMESNKSLLKYYEITTSYDQESYNVNNGDEGDDGDNVGGAEDDDVDNTNIMYTITPSLDLSKNHQCDICDRKFQRKYHLVRHMLVHTKVRAFSCEQCQRTFARSDQKAQHRKDGCKSLRRNVNRKKH